MEAADLFEMLVARYQTTRCHNPQKPKSQSSSHLGPLRSTN